MQCCASLDYIKKESYTEYHLHNIDQFASKYHHPAQLQIEP